VSCRYINSNKQRFSPSPSHDHALSYKSFITHLIVIIQPGIACPKRLSSVTTNAPSPGPCAHGTVICSRFLRVRLSTLSYTIRSQTTDYLSYCPPQGSRNWHARNRRTGGDRANHPARGVGIRGNTVGLDGDRHQCPSNSVEEGMSYGSPRSSRGAGVSNAG
jgi:hypothetical protein